jgi:ubiquinone/menaquinone biosynthesis C-methylase UbiE
MVKTRGLKEADKKLGNLDKIVASLLKEKKKIKIFESGCGYGKVMMELSKKYGSKIEIIGMNLKPGHGDQKKMVSFAQSEKVINKKDLKKMKIPKIIFGEADVKIPFKKNSIDLVYSQTSSYLYRDKLNFYKEVARVLTKNGIARITIHETWGVPEEFLPLFRIYKKGKQIGFRKFIQRIRGIELKTRGGRKFTEIKKSNLRFNAKLEASVNLNKPNKKWFGVQSIYSIK